MSFTLPTVEDKTLAGLGKLLGRWRDHLTRWLSLPALHERGRLLEVTVTTAAQAFDHGLGVAPAGWLVLRVRGSAPGFIVETAVDDKTLTLQASTTLTVALWVWPP